MLENNSFKVYEDILKLQKNNFDYNIKIDNLDIPVTETEIIGDVLESYINNAIDIQDNITNNIVSNEIENLEFNEENGETSKVNRIGDFTGLEGSTIDDILDRIPDDAILRELYPVEGGAKEGFEFKWNKDGQTYRVRVHNTDPSSPAGSNASKGWVVRIQRGRQYYDPTIEDFQPDKFTNPNGDYFDEDIMNNTHIPIKTPYNT